MERDFSLRSDKLHLVCRSHGVLGVYPSAGDKYTTS